MLSDTQLQVVSDHYSQSLTILKGDLKKRDYLISLILIVLVLLMFQVYAPEDSSRTISEFVSSKLGVDTAVNLSYITTAIWFWLLAVSLRYYQIVVDIERQYDYLHSLEKIISNSIPGGSAFTNESTNYHKSIRAFKKWSHLVYTVIFPTLLLITVVSSIVLEHIRDQSQLLAFDTVLALFVIASTILYLFDIHK